MDALMPWFQLSATWLTERKLVAILLIWGESWLLMALILVDGKVSASIVQLISVGVGGFTTAIGIMAQSIWREGHVGVDTSKENGAKAPPP